MKLNLKKIYKTVLVSLFFLGIFTSHLTLAQSNKNIKDPWILKTQILKLLNNTDDKVYISHIYSDPDILNKKFIIIITKDNLWYYYLNFISWINWKEITDLSIKKHKLFNKNFYKNNLIVFDNNFVYIEYDKTNKQVYFYDKESKHVVDESNISKYFNIGIKDKETWKYKWLYIQFYNPQKKENELYKFLTNTDIYSFLGGNSNSINMFKTKPFFTYKNGVFRFYNIQLSTSPETNIEPNDVLNLIKISKSDSISYFKDWKLTWHNFIIEFDLNKQKTNIIQLKDPEWNNILYYNTLDTSLKDKTLIGKIKKDLVYLLYQISDSNNNDKFLKFYLIKESSDKIQTWINVFNTKVKDNSDIPNNAFVTDKYQYKYYNNRVNKNIYEDDNFILYNFKKNDYYTLLIYNKKTKEVTEFKDIVWIKKITSNYWMWKYNVEITFLKKVSNIKKLQTVKIDEDDNIQLEANMNDNSKITYFNKWLFVQQFNIINKQTLFYKNLWYYNLKDKLLFSENKNFFIDYWVEKNKFTTFVINKIDWTNYINKLLDEKFGDSLNKINKVNILNNWYALISVNYTKKNITQEKKIVNNINSYLLFNFKELITLPVKEDETINSVVISPIYNKVLIWTKDKFKLFDLTSNSIKEISTQKIPFRISKIISFYWLLNKKENKRTKTIVLFYNNSLYFLNKNYGIQVDFENQDVKIIISWTNNTIYNYNGHWILTNIDDFGKTNIYIDWKKIISGSFFGVDIQKDLIILYNKKDIVLVYFKKLLDYNKILKFNNLIDKYIYNLKNPQVIYFYNLFKDTIYLLNNKNIDRNIIMNIFYKYYSLFKKLKTNINVANN